MKALSRLVLLPLAFLATCTGIGVGAFRALEPAPVKLGPADSVPVAFPVVVLWEKEGIRRASVVEHPELEAFANNHPDHSFRIPAGATEALNAQLAATSRETARGDERWRDGSPWRMTFEVESASKERQVIRAEKTWDDDRVNIGWYEVTAEGIRPLRHQAYFGPGIAMAALLVATVATALVWGLAWGCLRLVGRRRRSNASPGAAA